jgi:hypothetical protein
VNEDTQVSVGTDTAPGYLFASLASTTNGDGYTETGQDLGPGEVTCETVSTTFGEYSTAATCGGTPQNGYGTPPYVPAVEFDTNTMSGLYPGGPAQPINFSITNPGTIPETVSSVTIAVASDAGTSPVEIESSPGNTGTDVAGCYADWFTISPSPVTVSATIPAGGTVDWIGTATIALDQSSSNQNDCQGATIGLTFTSS